MAVVYNEKTTKKTNEVMEILKLTWMMTSVLTAVADEAEAEEEDPAVEVTVEVRVEEEEARVPRSCRLWDWWELRNISCSSC